MVEYLRCCFPNAVCHCRFRFPNTVWLRRFQPSNAVCIPRFQLSSLVIQSVFAFSILIMRYFFTVFKSYNTVCSCRYRLSYAVCPHILSALLKQLLFQSSNAVCLHLFQSSNVDCLRGFQLCSPVKPTLWISQNTWIKDKTGSKELLLWYFYYYCSYINNNINMLLTQIK